MTDMHAPDPLPDAELTKKDRSYSPSSGRETERAQAESQGDEVLPGTGGPDDNGDLETDESELRPPREDGSH